MLLPVMSVLDIGLLSVAGDVMTSLSGPHVVR